jgi:hypothetical protein
VARKQTQTTTLATLRPDPANRRRHPERNVEMIAASLREVGAARSLVIDETDEVLAGNGVLAAAPRAGISKLRIIEARADTLIAVRVRGLTDGQKRALAIFDNRSAELAEWNLDQLAADAGAQLPLTPFWTPEEEAALMARGAENEIGEMAAAGDGHEPAAVTTGDYQTFSVPLSLEQERVVRAALRQARAVYQVTTAGEALACALKAWVAAQEATDG